VKKKKLHKNGIEKFATPSRCQSAAGIIIAVTRRRLLPAVIAVNQLGGPRMAHTYTQDIRAPTPAHTSERRPTGELQRHNPRKNNSLCAP